MMQLEWTAAMRDVAKQRHVISAEFLQPYRSAGGAVCTEYMTCLACMTDTACGWCGNRCVDRLSDVSVVCADEDASFIINAEYCPVCADHVTCSTCLQVLWHSCFSVHNCYDRLDCFGPGNVDLVLVVAVGVFVIMTFSKY